MKSFIVLFLLAISMPVEAQTFWCFELQLGYAMSMPTSLIIKQKGYNDIKINNAEYKTESLNDPLYWSWRIARWRKNKSIEFEAIHHKFFLQNLPIEVQRFSVSHVYNMIFLNKGFNVNKTIWRLGLGTTIVHGESTIRNKSYSEGTGFDIKGHRLRGVGINLAISKQLKINRLISWNIESKINAAYAHIPIVNGYAIMPMMALQIITGPVLIGLCKY